MEEILMRLDVTQRGLVAAEFSVFVESKLPSGKRLRRKRLN